MAKEYKVYFMPSASEFYVIINNTFHWFKTFKEAKTFQIDMEAKLIGA